MTGTGLMLHVAIVGDRASGKTTFLGLLYAALVSSGSGRQDALRFHVAYESLDEITALYQRLMSGGFPDAAAKEGLRELHLELEVAGVSRRILGRLGSGKGRAGLATTVRFSLPGSLGEATQGLHQGSTFGTGRWRDALDADVLVMLADATQLAAKGTDGTNGPMAGYDGRLEALFIAIQRWRSSGGRELLYPVFAISKFDAVSPKTLKAANLEASPPTPGKIGPRAAYGKGLLGPNLPRTLALLEGPVGKKLRFAPPTFVFSSVRTDPVAPGQPQKIRLRRTDGGGWEPEYARAECVAFLESLARVGAEMKE